MNKFGLDLPRSHKRIEKLFEEARELANKDDIIVDVGTDHGYLAAMLAMNHIGSKVIATDVSAPSLKKAEKLVREKNLSVECRVGDGLSVAKDATLACICGIGGNEIIKILDSSNFCGKMVLQPVPTEQDLRKYLIDAGYNIKKDYVIYAEHKFYFIFVVEGKKKKYYSKKDKLFGKTNIKDNTADFQEYLKSQIKNLSFLENFDITNLSKQSKKEITEKQQYLLLCKELQKRG